MRFAVFSSCKDLLCILHIIKGPQRFAVHISHHQRATRICCAYFTSSKGHSRPKYAKIGHKGLNKPKKHKNEKKQKKNNKNQRFLETAGIGGMSLFLLTPPVLDPRNLLLFDFMVRHSTSASVSHVAFFVRLLRVRCSVRMIYCFPGPHLRGRLLIGEYVSFYQNTTWIFDTWSTEHIVSVLYVIHVGWVWVGGWGWASNVLTLAY